MSRNDSPVSFNLSPDLKDELVQLAKKNQRSVTQELVIAVRAHVARGPSPSPEDIDRELLRSVIREELQKMEKREGGSGPL